jgi:hypothetical protein
MKPLTPTHPLTHPQEKRRRRRRKKSPQSLSPPKRWTIKTLSLSDSRRVCETQDEFVKISIGVDKVVGRWPFIEMHLKRLFLLQAA